ncbi:MAG: hypothetical protein EBQ95_06715 [Gammaproteobacteria bacterium]|nr:hypothetical protein [Gammaproteobacteria bacterium]
MPVKASKPSNKTAPMVKNGVIVHFKNLRVFIIQPYLKINLSLIVNENDYHLQVGFEYNHAM